MASPLYVPQTGLLTPSHLQPVHSAPISVLPSQGSPGTDPTSGAGHSDIYAPAQPQLVRPPVPPIPGLPSPGPGPFPQQYPAGQTPLPPLPSGLQPQPETRPLPPEPQPGQPQSRYGNPAWIQQGLSAAPSLRLTVPQAARPSAVYGSADTMHPASVNAQSMSAVAGPNVIMLPAAPEITVSPTNPPAVPGRIPAVFAGGNGGRYGVVAPASMPVFTPVRNPAVTEMAEPLLFRETSKTGL